VGRERGAYTAAGGGTEKRERNRREDEREEGNSGRPLLEERVSIWRRTQERQARHDGRRRRRTKKKHFERRFHGASPWLQSCLKSRCLESTDGKRILPPPPVRRIPRHDSRGGLLKKMDKIRGRVVVKGGTGQPLCLQPASALLVTAGDGFGGPHLKNPSCSSSHHIWQ